jgi:tetratricopeptide (TPR) repeat protein
LVATPLRIDDVSNIKMSKLYNPDLMPREQIKRTFVGREKLLEEIVAIAKNQPKGAGVQHIVIIAPRGMGKTTLLLMLRFEVEDSNLSKKWQAVQFPEESYDIYELADFWVKVAEYLAADTDDGEFLNELNRIKNTYSKNEDLHEAAFALLKDWRKKHKKQLLLLIDNFDMILEQINNEQDTARLRKVLMNDDTVMLIGTAVTFFKEVRGYEHPLYNFFKIYNLEGFRDEQIIDFLRLRAKDEGVENFEELFRENKARIRTLAYFTDGNPRLVLMLFDVITKSKLSDVQHTLEKLLDEVTPYFKSKIELLPPQQRKVLDYIARMSFEKREGVSPTEVSTAIRLSPNQTSAQLKRLMEDGYVKSANVRSKNSFYVISEPLVAIWYQMRFGRLAYQKRRWLIFILKGLYELDEMRNEQEKLGIKYQRCLASGDNIKAQEVLKHKLYLAEAMPDGSGAKMHYEHFVSQSIWLNDEISLKEELKNPDLLKRLSPKLLSDLLKQGRITKSQHDKATETSVFSELSKNENDSIAELMQGNQRMSELSPEKSPQQISEALEHFNKAIKLDSNNTSALVARSSFFYQFGKFRECLADCESLIKILEDSINKLGRTVLANDLASAYMNKGVSLDNLGKLNEAIIEYDKAIEIIKSLVEQGKTELANDLASAYMNKGVSLGNLGKLNEAIIEYDKAIEILKDLVEQGRTELANDLAKAYINKGVSLDNLGKLNEAIIEYDKAIEILKDLVEQGRTELANELAKAYMNKGVSLGNLGKLNEAIIEFDKAIEIRKPLVEQGRTELANDLAKVYMNKGVSLRQLGKLDEAIAEYDKSIDIYEVTFKDNQSWEVAINSARTYLNLIEGFIEQNSLNKVGEYLQKTVNILDSVGYEDFNAWILKILFSTVSGNDYSNLRKLIEGEEMENRFFPILRAVDYLETKDESLIEKLSPEVLGVVEEAIRKLQSIK